MSWMFQPSHPPSIWKSRAIDALFFLFFRLRLDLEWDEAAGGSRLVVLDEAQTWPEIFSRLRGAIDGDRRRNGRFLLLGSISPSLMTQVSESLAGRLSVVELTPLLHTELRNFVIDQALASMQSTGRPFEAFHLRTSDQREIDLLIRTGTELWAMEIKLTTRPALGDLARLEANADLVGADRRFLVCQRSDFIESGARVICDLEGLLGRLEKSTVG